MTEIDKNSKNSAWPRLLLLVLILGSISLLLYETGAIRFFLSKKRLLAFLDSLGPWGFAGFIVLQSLQVVVAPVPGELTGFLGGYLYGPYLGTALSTVGLTLGSVLAFLLARAFGRPFVEKCVSTATLQRFDYLLHHKGAFLVFLLFLIPKTRTNWVTLNLGCLLIWAGVYIEKGIGLVLPGMTPDTLGEIYDYTRSWPA